MIIKSLKIENLQLIKSTQVDFEKINIISGKNLDSPNESGNGSGKSTICLRAILFALYGYCEEGLTLKDLVRFKEKECSVEIECSLNNEHFIIIRKIPTELHIFRNNNEIQANTNTIKQKIIDEAFGDVNFFRQYRCCDLKNGIDVLDLGIVSLRKTLMGFIESYFTEIRTRLLAKKAEREKYSVNKKPYHFYLSTKRKCLLENGLIQLIDIKKQLQKNIDKQYEIYNNTLIDIQAKTKLIDNIDNNSIENQIEELNALINNSNKIILELKKIEDINYIDYIKVINNLQEKNENICIDIEYLEDGINNHQIEKNNINTKIEIIKTKSKKIEEQIINLEEEIKNIQSLNSNSKCDKCGSIIEENKKELFITEKQEEIKKLINEQNTFDLEINHSKLATKLEEDELDKLNTELKNLKTELKINNNQIKELNEKNIEQSKLKEKISLKDADIKKHNELIEMNEIRIKKLIDSIETNKITIKRLFTDIEQLKKQTTTEKDKLDSLKIKKEVLELKENKIEQYLMKLTEAFKFSEYKYTVEHIALYDASIKVLDAFASTYLKEWLSNLSIIINNLLQPINLSIEFTTDKTFLSILDNNQILKFDQLSCGQKAFLSVIFKLAILMQNNKTGLIILDDSLNNIDWINFKNLINIIKILPFQPICVYQGIQEQIEDTKQFIIIREKGMSYVKN